MARHTINITVPNSAAGIPTAKEGVVGILAKGVAVGGTLALDTPYALKKLSDLIALGVNAAYDVANGVAVYQQVSEFYAQAGDGALCWLQVCAKNTTYATYVASATFRNFINYSAQADITQQIKLLGICYDVPTATQAAADFPADVTNTLTAIQTARNLLFAQGKCFGVILDGYNMDTTVTPTTIGTMATATNPNVSLCITGTKGNGVSAVGLALGKYARISVGRGVGAVEDGAINTTTAFLTNGILVAAGGALIVDEVCTVQGGPITYNAVVYNIGDQFTVVTGHLAFTTTAGGYVLIGSTPINNIGGKILGMDQDDLDTLGDKQYFFITTVSGITGLFWNDGATCTAEDNFFSSMEYTRVANAISYDARQFFTLLRGLNLPSDSTTGDLDSSFCAGKAKSFKTIFIDPLTAASGSGDISDGKIVVSGPNYAGTGNLKFAITMTRATILGEVDGTIEFALTL